MKALTVVLFLVALSLACGSCRSEAPPPAPLPDARPAVQQADREPPRAAAPASPSFRMHGQSYQARRTKRPLKVDGRLDERAWKVAPAAGAFMELDAVPLEGTAIEAKLLWDERNLYVAVRNEDENVSSTLSSANVATSSEDAIEVVIRERGARGGPLTVRLAANGAISEQGRPTPAAGQTPVPVRGAVRVQGTLDRPGDKDRGWSAEIAIPASALGAQDGSGSRRALAWGDLWEVNLFRVDKAPGQTARRWAWSRLFDRDPYAAEQAGDVRLADEKGEDPTSVFEAQEKEREKERDRAKERDRERGR
jgi:hypothetical protein